jgi:hypothetical protein
MVFHHCLFFGHSEKQMKNLSALRLHEIIFALSTVARIIKIPTFRLSLAHYLCIRVRKNASNLTVAREGRSSSAASIALKSLNPWLRRLII